ncbi:hypothetical protein NSK_005218 [Nannochloropsis salina CCMP1776]|uniref:Uncharacterized protein n=1 Tax=Nannochloropsis salina CCMP1776 TaxID=1027361 RepID=A0A4D9CWB2_9STRA|nr:hypothetical protein NSK_005218 [Nannochloropsis salina CCMP1776]|eukprot:TFJ83480.1 hypothetical protein NSK_005218 [Nannochloropsis salina CCMP1776]
MRPIFLHLAPVLCPIFLLAVVVSLVEAGWLGYLFGGKDATPTATLTQSPATLEACEAVLVTNMTETVQESVTDAESRLLSSSRTTFRAERTQTLRIESTEGGEAGEGGGMGGREVKHITLEQRLQLARLIVAVAKKDKEKVVACYRAMGFRTRYDRPETIYRYASVIWDRDDKEHLEGKNIQEYLEELQEEDPVEHMPQDFVMAGRVALLLRGLALVLKYHVSAAAMWAPLAQELLDEYGEEEGEGEGGGRRVLGWKGCRDDGGQS